MLNEKMRVGKKNKYFCAVARVEEMFQCFKSETHACLYQNFNLIYFVSLL